MLAGACMRKGGLAPLDLAHGVRHSGLLEPPIGLHALPVEAERVPQRHQVIVVQRMTIDGDAAAAGRRSVVFVVKTYHLAAKEASEVVDDLGMK